jgi:ADP-heptose:LPS heptosyltransferase
MGLDFQPKKILVFRIGHLGDTLVTLPAFWTLRNAYPQAHITLLTNVNAKHRHYLNPMLVLPEKGLFDDWMNYPTDAGWPRTIAGFAKLFFAVRRHKFDTLVYLMTRYRQPYQVRRDLTFFKLAGIRQHIGTKYLLKNYLPLKPKPPLPVMDREYDYLVKCLTEEGVAAALNGSEAKGLLLTEAEKESAENWLKENIGSNFSGLNLVAVVPGANWESRIWPEEKFTQTLLRLITNRDIFPVIFGGPNEVNKGDAIIRALGRGVNAAGKFSIRESAAAFSLCKLYLGNDTGPMHLAGLVGTPCVAIFSAIDYPGRWYPSGDRNIILRKTVPCEGCHSRNCKFNHECLETSVDEVYEACLKVLDSKWLCPQKRKYCHECHE